MNSGLKNIFINLSLALLLTINGVGLAFSQENQDLDKAELRKKEKKQENKTKHFYAPKNFNKGGRVGVKRGTFPDLSGDGQVTKEDILIGRGVIPKPKSKKKTMMAKKSKSPMDKTVRKA